MEPFHAAFDIRHALKELTIGPHGWIYHAQKLDDSSLNNFVNTLKKWKTEIAAFAKKRLPMRPRKGSTTT